MRSLELLYGDVDNLAGLIHPVWQRGFNYMSDRAVIHLAESLTRRVIASGVNLVVVAETGASPLAELCERIADYKDRFLNWRRVKFPRDPLASIFPTLNYFLSDAERESTLCQDQLKMLKANALSAPLRLDLSTTRRQALKLICSRMPGDFFESGHADIAALLDGIGKTRQSEFQHAVSTVFEGTESQEQFGRPFVYFDEYIDSGTTFRNALAFFRCLTKQPMLKTCSYYINFAGALHNSNVLYAHWTVRNKPHCYEIGAYPYENRVDLIGHFYRVTSEEYVRTDVAAISEALFDAPPANCEAFLSKLYGAVLQNKLHELVSARFVQPEVRAYVRPDDAVRHCLLTLEKRCGDADWAEFLFQLFDMYGPAWSPMPVEFHFDFWNGFEGLEAAFERIPEFAALCQAYVNCRQAIMKGAARICCSRRATWLARMDRQLEGIYAKQSFSRGGNCVNPGVCSRQSH